MDRQATINRKEIIAWVALAIAATLLSISFAWAQGKSKAKADAKTTTKNISVSTDNDDGKIHINIIKIEDGKKTKIDTTVDEKDFGQLKKYFKNMNIDIDVNGDEMAMNMHHAPITKREREELKKEMECVKKEMRKLKNEMKGTHLEIIGEDDDDPENFDMHLRMSHPPQAPMPPGNSYSYSFSDGEDDDNDSPQPFMHQFHFFNDDITDSLNDEAHIVVAAEKGEEMPVFEKEVTGKNGEKYFVYKRKFSKEAEVRKSVSTSLAISKLRLYPNPCVGKFSLSFQSKNKGDLTITIADANGKEVYRNSMKDFNGEYFNQFDISDKGKGAYILRIIQGGEELIKKILVE